MENKSTIKLTGKMVAIDLDPTAGKSATPLAELESRLANALYNLDMCIWNNRDRYIRYQIQDEIHSLEKLIDAELQESRHLGFD